MHYSLGQSYLVPLCICCFMAVCIAAAGYMVVLGKTVDFHHRHGSHMLLVCIQRSIMPQSRAIVSCSRHECIMY